jgi:hypothetical protein
MPFHLCVLAIPEHYTGAAKVEMLRVAQAGCLLGKIWRKRLLKLLKCSEVSKCWLLL